MREKRVNLKIPAYVRETLTALETAGHQAYCVGGCVRDSLLGRMPEDWDVTTSALPEETMKVFGNRAIPTGLKHGTVTVCCQEGKVETTTFRRDGVYADHRHPEQVTFTPDLTEDLARRDFTVNAMEQTCGGRCMTPSTDRRTCKREFCAAWAIRSGGFRRTPCGSCAACGLRRCWAFPSNRKPTRH